MSKSLNTFLAPETAEEVPQLHLDGRILRTAFESMVECSEKLGGVELIIEGLEGKSQLFQRTFSGNGENMFETEFFDACAFMPTVRRRLKPILKNSGFQHLRNAVVKLLDGISLENVDTRLQEITHTLASEKKDRWPPDLAAEILHYRNPETFPLMTRWIWDSVSNSGVLREIWFSEMQTNQLSIPHGIRTHLELRRELNDFLEDLGVFANRNFMIDILFAWIYSQYIGSQGGTFLRTEFSHSQTPFNFALRMLGLDAALTKSGKTSLILADGNRYSLSGTFDASSH